MTIQGKRLAEFARDVQVALPRVDVPEFDALKEIGMAATLAIHLRGMPALDLSHLRKVSDYFFDIPSYALKLVLPILEEVEFIQIVRTAGAEQVIPQVPFFEDLYATIGDYADTRKFTEHEQVTAEILGRLFASPVNKDALRTGVGAEKDVFARCLRICTDGTLAVEKRARGRDIVISPFYFADNLEGLADAAAAGRVPEIQRVLALIKDHQGWPLSLIQAQKEIAGHKLSGSELQIVDLLSQNLLLKPPSIATSAGETINFLFTPRPGDSRLNATNREIYERAMAIVSAVRKGQLLADRVVINSPRVLLNALRSRGKLGKNSDAYNQYQKLVQMRVGQLIPAGRDQAEFHLLQNEENEQALDLAIELVTTGDLQGTEVNRGAREALQKDERYVDHLLSASELKKRSKLAIDAEVEKATEQLLFGFIK